MMKNVSHVILILTKNIGNVSCFDVRFRFLHTALDGSDHEMRHRSVVFVAWGSVQNKCGKGLEGGAARLQTVTFSNNSVHVL
jgi:hypothetical protein